MSIQIQDRAPARVEQGGALESPNGASRHLARRSPPARHFTRFAGVGGVGILVGAALGTLIASNEHPPSHVVVTAAAPFTVSGPRSESTLAHLIAGVRPSVVSITVTTSAETDLGSGVVVSRDGMILTANHVIAHAGKITIRLADERVDTARIVARAPRVDLAVLQARALRHLIPATFVSAKALQMGDEVLVIGNPLGLAGTVTRGIVSATHRSVPVDTDPAHPHVDPILGLPDPAATTAFIRGGIQTDAVVYPGDSGGPLVDMHGHVVGILCTVASDESAESTPDTGLALAIPSDTAWPTAIRLMAHA